MAGTFVQDLAVVAAVAGVTAAIARSLGQSTIVGYLAAGFLVGPYVPVPLFADHERVHALAEFGVILVMFAVGLEFKLARLFALLPRAGPITLFQVGALGWLGATVARWMGFTGLEPTFLGAGLAISSTMVVSRVFDTAKVDRGAKDLVFGVLVVQDVVAIVLVAVLSAVAKGGEASTAVVALTLAKLGGAMLGLGIVGTLVLPRVLRRVVALGSAEATVVTTAGVGFGFAALATALGYSSALGAFLGGVLVAESGVEEQVEPLVRPLRDLFAAVFFVSIGMEVDPWVAVQNAPAIFVATMLVIGGQLGTVTLAGVLSGNGLRNSVVAGLSLGQVGEFGFLLGAIGVAAGASPSLPTVLVGVALVTSFTTPLLVGKSDAIVSWIDHALPPRIQRILSAYETWFERVRRGRGSSWSGIRVVALDVVMVVVIVVAAATWWEEGTEALLRIGVPHRAAVMVVPGAAAIGVVPLLVGASRSTRTLARRVAVDAVPEGTQGGEPVRRLIEASVHLLVLLGAGLPVLALVRPFFGSGGDVLALFVLVAAVAGNQLWRRAAEVDDAIRSGAQELANILAKPHGDTLPPQPPTIPGIEGVSLLTLRADSPAVGRSLKELDLRARSGATVVALLRRDREPGPPAVTEPFVVGDVLGLIGTHESVEEARRLLGG